MNSPVAIDLGDAFCRVGLYRQHDGRVRILPDFEVCGSCYSIPSCVAFVNNARLVGTAARMQSVSDPARTVCRIKRLLGKSYSEVVELCGNTAFQITPATDGSNHIIIKDEFYPEEIVAVLINKMRGLITYSAKQCVKDVVITVPAYFNDAQRQATLDAAEIAGVRVAALLNETTAAAFFYARTAKGRPTNVLFYDLGGGHLSVTVARISDSEVMILGTASTQKVSGSEFTDRFVAHVSERVIQSYGQDLTLNTSAYALLYLLCDRIKCELSYNLTSTLKLRGVMPNILIQMTITRAEFQEVCQDIFRTAMEPVDKAIQCANLTIDDIDDVTVLGGSARIPMIETLLLEKFNKRRINKSLHSEETVVYGATLYAAQLAKLLPNPVRVCDVIDHGIGIEQPRAIVSPLINPNTQIPCSFRRIFSTTPGGEQSCLNLRLYEGNRARTTENNFLGSIDISELRPAFGGIHEAIVELEVDRSGILKAVIFPDARLHGSKYLEIRKTGLSVESKHNACKAFARSLSGDAQMRRLSEYRHYLESFAYLLLSATGAKELKLQEQEIQCLRRQSSEILRWLRSNPNAALDETDEKIRVVQDTIISNVRCPLEGLLHYALHFTNPVNVHE